MFEVSQDTIGAWTPISQQQMMTALNASGHLDDMRIAMGTSQAQRAVAAAMIGGDAASAEILVSANDPPSQPLQSKLERPYHCEHRIGVGTRLALTERTEADLSEVEALTRVCMLETEALSKATTIAQRGMSIT